MKVYTGRCQKHDLSPQQPLKISSALTQNMLKGLFQGFLTQIPLLFQELQTAGFIENQTLNSGTFLNVFFTYWHLQEGIHSEDEWLNL